MGRRQGHVVGLARWETPKALSRWEWTSHGSQWWGRSQRRLDSRMTLSLANGRSLALRIGAIWTRIRETS